jgi:hypothetical protein
MNLKLASKLFFFFLLNSTLFYCQNILIGQWYLDKVKFSNGADIEVNNPMFSTFNSLRFNNQKVFNSTALDEDLFTISDYKFDGRKLNFLYRDFNVEKEGKYLVLKSQKEGLNYYYLKGEDFPSETIAKQEYDFIKSDSIAVRSLKFDPYFDNSEENLMDYLYSSIPDNEYKNRRVYFTSSFILTKNNKIKDLKITNGKNPLYDKEYRKAIQKSEKYWKNNTGKDVLITRNVSERKFGDGREDEISAYQYSEIADEFYRNNDFKNALLNYLKSDEYWRKDKDKGNFQEPFYNNGNYLKLGICYLIENDRDKACEYFKRNGGISDFAARNYILTFCMKP